jgi:tetratricopeptide (TPR) repeat protein
MRALLLVGLLSRNAYARESIVELIRRLVDERRAQERVEAEAAQALFDAARAQRPAAALTTLARLADEHPRWAAVAHVASGEFREMLGHRRRAIAEYRAALRAKSVDIHTSIMDARNTDGIAAQALGRLLEAEGDWRGAYRAWRAWRPHSWCGNEAAEQYEERRLGMARALFRLGRTDAAIGYAFDAVGDGFLTGPNRDAGRLIAEIAASAGRIDEVRRRARREKAPIRRMLERSLAAQKQ